MIRRFALLFLILFAWGAFVPQANGFYGRIRGMDTPEGRYMRLRDVRGLFQFAMFRFPDRLELRGNGFVLELVPGRRVAKLDGAPLYLNYAPKTDRDGNYLLHRSDVCRTLPAFFPSERIPLPERPVVLLDPGHGGEDTGATHDGVMEKNINLQIALRVANLLKKSGVNVLMTREDDRTLSLEERSAMATRLHADLFISIHQNSASNLAAYGTEFFAMTPPGAASSFGSTHVTAKNDIGNRFDSESLLLAHAMRQNVVRETGIFDRGVKHARFRVLRLTDAPAALIECAFLSNAGERKNLTNEQYQEKMATGIANGILSYIRSRSDAK